MFSRDPQSLSDVFCVHSGAGLTGIAAFDLNDGLRIDIGHYEHVLVLVANGGGTTTGVTTITPKVSDTQSGPEFNLDGTGGLPDARMTFTTANGDISSRQRVLRVRGLRRFLNITVSLAATGTIRPAIYVIGYGPRVSSGVNIETNLSPLTIT